jgi:hypothetical protein
MRILLAVVLFFLTSLTAQSSPETPKQKTSNPQQTAPADQRGTEQLPAVVKILPTPKTAEETEADRKERAEKADSDWALVKLTGALAIVGALQLLVFGYQAWKLRQTVQAAAQQSEDMEKSIAESARSATAMEAVAQSIAISAKAAVESASRSAPWSSIAASLCWPLIMAGRRRRKGWVGDRHQARKGDPAHITAHRDHAVSA